MSDSTSGFRPAEPADVVALVDLIRSAYRGEASREGWTSEADYVEGDRIDEPQVQEMIGARNSMILVLVENATILACCYLENRDNGTAYLGTFAVRPHAQARGLGQRVLVESERMAKEKYQATRLEISVLSKQDQLIAYYERRGFRRTGEVRPFPTDPALARPRVDDALYFIVLEKSLETSRHRHP